MAIVLGVVLLVGGVALLVWAAQQASRAGEMASAETVTAARLTELCQEARAKDHGRAFRQRVELKGVLNADEPLTARQSGKVCGAYVSTVKCRYEEISQRRNERGITERHTSLEEEVVSEHREEARCHVVDGTGRIEVDLAGAEMDMTVVVDEFKRDEQSVATSLASTAGDLITGDHHRRKRLGYQHSESILPLGRAVYVLGEACDEGGRLRVCKGGPGRFLVSLKSEEDLTDQARSNFELARGFGVLFVLGGLVLLALGVS
jgi:hypothetical protein